jgi:hypothetical protein
MSHARSQLVVLVATLGLVAIAGCTTPREWSRPYDGHLPGTGPENVSVTVVRDARTGAPLAGVTVRQYLETIDPRTLRAPLLAEAVTDAFGLVSVTWSGEMDDCHWVFEKPGHAVTETYGYRADPKVELAPGQELHGVLLDPFDKPYGGVEVELFLGCGHSPAVRRAVTDEDGRFCLRDIAPDRGTLWYPADGIAAGYVNDTLGTRDHPLVIETDPGRVVTGRVVDANGQPVPDVVVRSHQEFRGPATRTSDDGRFRLTGFTPSGDLYVHGPDGGYAWVDGNAIDFDRTLTVVLRADHDNDGRPDWKAESVPLRFEVVDASSGTPVPGASVFLHRPEDGRIFWANLALETVDAPPGKYELRVGNAFSSHVAGPQPFTVRVGDTAVHRIEARVQPTLALEWNKFPEEDAHLEVVLADDLLLVPQGEKATPVHLPPEAEAVVRATAEGLVRYYPVGKVENGRRRATIDWPAMKRIRVVFDGFDRLSLLEEWSVRIDERTIETHAGGRVTLLVDDEALGRREFPIDIPDRPGAEVRVPRNAGRTPGVLTVLLPDETPAAECSVRVDGERFLALDEQGTLTSWLVRPGAAVVVEKAGHVELRRTLEGTGPHRLAWGRASLEVRVPDTPEFVVYVDGELFGAENGQVRVAGLDAGPHIVIVAAHGQRGRAMQIVLEEGEARALEVPLGSG